MATAPVGRDDEFRVVARTLEAGSSVVVTGGAGVGKSTLLRAVANLLGEAGWASCSTLTTGSPREGPPGSHRPRSCHREGQIRVFRRRLRLHGLIARQAGTHRYQVTGDGMRICLFMTKVHHRVIRPVLRQSE